MRTRVWALLLVALLAACGSGQASSGGGAASRGPSPSRAQGPAASGAPTFARGTVSIQTKTGVVTLNVEIADDPNKREYGLMNRRSLPPDDGMLFVFQPPANASRVGFWMKDTLIPLSIAFVEPNMTIESLQEMQPLSEELHAAPRDFAYALEANKGFFTSHGVAVGDTITIKR